MFWNIIIGLIIYAFCANVFYKVWINLYYPAIDTYCTKERDSAECEAFFAASFWLLVIVFKPISKISTKIAKKIVKILS